jgi:hypothetical protein
MEKVNFTIDFSHRRTEILFMKYKKRYLKDWSLTELPKYNDGSNTGKYNLTIIGYNFSHEEDMLINYLENRNIEYSWN